MLTCYQLATILLGLIKLHRGTCILERKTAPYSENNFKQELSRLAREARYYKSVILQKDKEAKIMFKNPGAAATSSNNDQKVIRRSLVGRTKTQFLRHENRQLRVQLDRAIQEIENLKQNSGTTSKKQSSHDDSTISSMLKFAPR